jgi:hypothetical protein
MHGFEARRAGVVPDRFLAIDALDAAWSGWSEEAHLLSMP